MVPVMELSLVTIILDFMSVEAACVDFGTGPVLMDTRPGGYVKTWIFVLILAFSRHHDKAKLDLAPDHNHLF
jgi:hypothetical protein